jgi:hypothetical protein
LGLRPGERRLALEARSIETIGGYVHDILMRLLMGGTGHLPGLDAGDQRGVPGVSTTLETAAHDLVDHPACLDVSTS